MILSQRIYILDSPCHVTVDDSTVKNGKYSSSCYNVTSVTNVKVCNFFVSGQSVCEVIPVHVRVVHVTTIVIVNHWNEISNMWKYNNRFMTNPSFLLKFFSTTHFKHVFTYYQVTFNTDEQFLLQFYNDIRMK